MRTLVIITRGYLLNRLTLFRLRLIINITRLRVLKGLGLHWRKRYIMSAYVGLSKRTGVTNLAHLGNRTGTLMNLTISLLLGRNELMNNEVIVTTILYMILIPGRKRERHLGTFKLKLGGKVSVLGTIYHYSYHQVLVRVNLTGPLALQGVNGTDLKYETARRGVRGSPLLLRTINVDLVRGGNGVLRLYTYLKERLGLVYNGTILTKDHLICTLQRLHLLGRAVKMGPRVLANVYGNNVLDLG